MKLITIYIPEPWLDFIDDLVKMKKYPHRADAIRNAIRDLIYREHPDFKHFIEEEMKKHAKKERRAIRA